MPAPVLPAPMTSRSTGSAAIAASAAARVRCENSVSLVGVLRLGPAGGPVVGFVPRAEENVMPVGNGRRVAVVAGCRTPFCRAGTALKDVRAVDLARGVARELIERTNLDGAAVNAVIFGQVVSSALVPNVAREVSLLPQFPKEIPAYSLNRACASSGQAVANAHDEIASGQADVVLAGGVESLSDIPILASRRLADILVEASKAKSLAARVRAFSRVRPRDLVPVSPAIAEPSTGETMGQSAEKMAKENHISREAQDRWALRSHRLAAQGTDDNRLLGEIIPWFPARPGQPVLTQDNGIRRDTSLEQMAKLKPVFDRRYGSVTAANSSPLTDGAAAVLLMSEEAARTLGYTPLAYIRSYAVAAVDPGWQLLQAPIFAVPKALERAGIAWADLGVIEVHEAFAAQVLSNLQGWAARGWEINEDIINVMGGSIAIGHPFGATGARIVTTLANELARRDTQFGLLSICAQGGMGFAMVLERR
jgi:acetyl-CoA acyltransferase